MTTGEMIGCLRAGNKYGILNDVMANLIAARLVDLEARLAATAARWNPVEKLLPELHRPVWLLLPDLEQIAIGCRWDYEPGCDWGLCADGFWYSWRDRKWNLVTVCTPYRGRVSHWQYLPTPEGVA